MFSMKDENSKFDFDAMVKADNNNVTSCMWSNKFAKASDRGVAHLPAGLLSDASQDQGLLAAAGCWTAALIWLARPTTAHNFPLSVHRHSRCQVLDRLLLEHKK